MNWILEKQRELLKAKGTTVQVGCDHFLQMIKNNMHLILNICFWFYFFVFIPIPTSPWMTEIIISKYSIDDNTHSSFSNL